MKFKINFNINVSLMTVRDFWRLIYLIARLEKNNVRKKKISLFKFKNFLKAIKKY